MNDSREKLIELLGSAESAFYWNSDDKSFVEKIADHLIANGVTVKAEEGDTELRLFQLTRECERLKSKNDDLAKAINALDCENSLLIEKIRSERTQRWIPVTERLPENRGEVLVCTKNEYYGTQNVSKAKFYCGDWHGQGGRWTNVTHWMPLPEPQKEE